MASEKSVSRGNLTRAEIMELCMDRASTQQSVDLQHALAEKLGLRQLTVGSRSATCYPRSGNCKTHRRREQRREHLLRLTQQLRKPKPGHCLQKYLLINTTVLVEKESISQQEMRLLIQTVNLLTVIVRTITCSIADVQNTIQYRQGMHTSARAAHKDISLNIHPSTLDTAASVAGSAASVIVSSSMEHAQAAAPPVSCPLPAGTWGVMNAQAVPDGQMQEHSAVATGEVERPRTQEMDTGSVL